MKPEVLKKEIGKAEIGKEERIFPFLFTTQLSLDIFQKTRMLLCYHYLLGPPYLLVTIDKFTDSNTLDHNMREVNRKSLHLYQLGFGLAAYIRRKDSLNSSSMINTDSSSLCFSLPKLRTCFLSLKLPCSPR